MKRSDAAQIEGAMSDPLLAVATGDLIRELRSRMVGLVLCGMDSQGQTQISWSGPIPLILGLREMMNLQIEDMVEEARGG